MDDRSKLVNNERLKLLATFVNGMGLATFAIGGLGPLISSIYGPHGLTRPVAILSAVCFLAAFVLHYAASLFLRRLVP
ncbi:VIT1/CCC1 family predicted Fe2+/Mn2+ transporter [Neorhizobium huautlense]|uniref:VIT1/CCC1 family predicted Fe2+/Mn2+ transporter n=1 Tax=Neorhizobium huautlense TaxID=67774 RepID=A0ABT9PX65_9HYPH|nr:VIT1/CCC1 family predicted Fe2+/Mn2+ transporter [Neorhizobium huautlense]